jgi:aspartyl protease family protein
VEQAKAMLRKIIFLGGLLAALAVAVPYLLQRNPDGFARLLRAIVQVEPQTSQPMAAAATPSAGQSAALSGRKVHIPADPRGHFIADFRLNGRTVSALVDTGATTVAINRSTARRIGIALQPADFRYQVNTANGATNAAAVTIETLQIGRIHLENVQAMVLEDKALAGTLIGMSFLKRLARFKLEDGALVLEQ